jgi:hypothetical protein
MLYSVLMNGGNRNMGFAFAMGTCYGCKKIFSFNPLKVPSISVNGEKEPICAQCVETVNPLRIANGLAPIIPAPDAYEACDENELI